MSEIIIKYESDDFKTTPPPKKEPKKEVKK
jgi:hypothetical protein